MAINIMLPFYGDFKYLQQTVNSVLQQNNSNWNLTVVDDGFPDHAVAEWFKTINDTRVTYLRNENNLGANGNYVRCLELATDEYCVILGADDLLEKNFIDHALFLIQKFPKAEIFQPGVVVIDEGNEVVFPLIDRAKSAIRPKISSPIELSGEELMTSLMLGNWLYFPSIIWKTEEIKKIGFRKGLNVCQDLGLCVDVASKGGILVLSPEQTFKYRRHSQSDSSLRAFNGERFIEESNFFNQLASEFKLLGWHKASFVARLRLMSRFNSLFVATRALKAGKSPWVLLGLSLKP